MYGMNFNGQQTMTWLEGLIQRFFPNQAITLRLKLTFVIVASMALSLLMTILIAVSMIHLKARQDIRAYQQESESKIRNTLKNYVDIAYTSMDATYKQAGDRAYLESHYGHRLKSVIDLAEDILRRHARAAARGEVALADAQQNAIEEIRQLRYDQGTGYLWINNTSQPFPRMIMHPTLPELNGRILKDPKFDCALGIRKNLFVAFNEVCRARGEGFVDYLWPKPTKNGLTEEQPKLSYVRLFQPWQWIIGTGIYVDDAMLDAQEKIKADIEKMRYDEGVGYLWINDTTEPIPQMVMHPILPELNGRVLDDVKYQCVGKSKKNLFVAFAEICREKGGGFVEYLWPKPGKDGLSEDQPKLSYVRRFPPLEWIVGTGVYIDDIQAMVRKKRRQVIQQQIGMTFALILPVALVSVLAVFIMIVLVGEVVRTINHLGEKLQEIAAGEGDLTKRIENTSDDEVGMLAVGFNNFLEKLSSMISQFKGSSNHVDQASRELAGVQQHLINSSRSLDLKVRDVNAEIKRLKQNMQSTAAASDSISQNLTSVDAAVTQFSSTFQNITDNAAVTSGLVNEAVEVVERATNKVEGFITKTGEINTIVDMISQISNQTKLLALNAGIEAARAGEAGRGFSVVAEEVKKLAEKVNQAAVGIREILDNIKQTTGNSIKEFEKIHLAIRDVNHSMTDIAAAVEEQSATTEEIASNVSESARGVKEVNSNITAMERLTHSLAGEIDDVKHESQTVTQQGEVLSQRADALSEQSSVMQRLIARFKLK